MSAGGIWAHGATLDAPTVIARARDAAGYGSLVARSLIRLLESAYWPQDLLRAACDEINRNPEQFISKVWGKTSLPKPLALLEQIQGDVKKGKIKKVHPLHLLMNILSMTVFPFVAKPMMTKVLQMNDAAFMQAMQERKKEIPKFIIESIKK